MGMPLNFLVTMQPAFGTHGEFSIGAGDSQIRVQYLLTKVRPGQQGTWENLLASQMKPWRETFEIKDLSFDELIQRDLDDSRVAHDLIPYLLGETGQHARFFPPVLAVLVPKREERTGIAPRYPTPTENGSVETYGALFEFQKAVLEGVESPLGVLKYNPQRSAIVIVDGQHRAMAVLALHRQINQSWGQDPFAPYYNHLQVAPATVAHIELPVCILFFPDLHEGNAEFREKGIDLITVCREIFIAVNRQAKPVSKSRELLLDDEDFAAVAMRRTLTHLKDRAVSEGHPARIYSFAFGDSDSDGGSAVVAGQLEFCSAVALHKMHAAASFSLPAAFNLVRSADVTSGVNVRNPERPAEILFGVPGFDLKVVSRRSAKTHKPTDTSLIANHLGELTDTILLPLFDRLRPFAAHNLAIDGLRTSLDDPNVRADPVQTKCRALLFDGAGNRHVFDEHVDRLKEQVREIRESGGTLPTHLSSQMNYCDSVTQALAAREASLKLERAFLLFNIDGQGFLAREGDDLEEQLKVVKARAKAIFDTVSTQAFQLGYLMAVLSHVERMLQAAASYDLRLKTTKFLSSLYLAGLNRFFSVTTARHRTLSGYVVEPRAKAFESAELGFRGLLAATNVRELNEKQWEFFRYMIVEIVHSRVGASAVMEVLNGAEDPALADAFRASISSLVEDIGKLRSKYFEAAMRVATESTEFRREIEFKQMQAKAQGKSDDEVKVLTEAAIAEKRRAASDACKEHLKASLGRVDGPQRILRRFTVDVATGDGEQESGESDGDPGVGSSDQSTTLDVSLVVDSLRHESDT